MLSTTKKEKEKEKKKEELHLTQLTVLAGHSDGYPGSWALGPSEDKG
jgi:hypothetical protein